MVECYVENSFGVLSVCLQMLERVGRDFLGCLRNCRFGDRGLHVSVECELPGV